MDKQRLANEIIHASNQGDLEAVKELIELIESGFSDSAVAFLLGYKATDFSLILATQCGHLKLVRYLIENGADIHINYDRPLQNASFYGYLETVKYLVEHGADIHARNDASFKSAIKYKKLEVAKYLKETTKKRLIDEFLIPYFCISKSSPQIKIGDKIKSAIPKEIIKEILYLSKYEELNDETNSKNGEIPMLKFMVLADLNAKTLDLYINKKLL